MERRGCAIVESRVLAEGLVHFHLWAGWLPHFRKNQYLETRGSILGVCLGGRFQRYPVSVSALSDAAERETNVDGEWEGSCTLKGRKEATMPPHCRTSTGSPWLGKCPSSCGVLYAAAIICPYNTFSHFLFFFF